MWELSKNIQNSPKGDGKSLNLKCQKIRKILKTSTVTRLIPWGIWVQVFWITSGALWLDDQANANQVENTVRLQAFGTLLFSGNSTEINLRNHVVNLVRV